jgi:hypothetical protein
MLGYPLLALLGPAAMSALPPLPGYSRHQASCEGSRPHDRVCIEVPPIEAVEAAEIETLRYGLNAIPRRLR